MAFVHRGLAHLCSVVTSAAVATGAGNTLGNKGGVAVFLKIADTKILIVNAHLAAHQNAERQRNADFAKISRGVPALLARKKNVSLLVARPEEEGVPVIYPSVALRLPPSATAEDDDAPAVDAIPTPTAASQDKPTTGNAERTLSSKTDLMDGLSADEKYSVALAPSGSKPHLLAAVTTLPSASDADIAQAEPKPEASTVAHTDAEQPAVAAAAAIEDDDEKDGDEVVFSAEAADPSDPADLTAPVDASGTPKTPHTAALGESGPRTLADSADVVVFMGDLNYRIRGNRAVVSSSLASNMHDVLFHNDQLR